MAQNDMMEKDRNEAVQDETLSAVLQRLGLGASGGAPPASQSPPATAASGAPSGDILSSLLSNPELIAKLPTIISSVKPILEMLVKSNMGATGTASVAALPVQSAPSAPTVKIDHSSDSRSALLCAMKPYLSEDRRNAIDYIVKLGRLGDILKTL